LNLQSKSDAHFWLLIAAHFRTQLILVIASCDKRDKQPPLNLENIRFALTLSDLDLVTSAAQILRKELPLAG